MTSNNMHVLFFAFLVAVSLLFSTSLMPVADANVLPTDKSDYFAQAIVAFEEAKKLDQEIAEDEKKIKKLEDRLKTTHDKIESISILAELEQTKSLKNARVYKVMALQNEINQLEQKNIQANTVDSTTEQNYITIEKAFYAKYLNATSPEFVGDNPVEGAYIDAQFKEFVVLANPSEIRNGGLDIDSLVSEYENTVNKMPGYDLTIKIELAEFVNVACSARDERCNISPEIADDLDGFLVSSSNADVINVSVANDEFILRIEICASGDGFLVLHDPLRYLQNIYGEKDMMVLFLADQTEVVPERKDNNVEIPFEEGTRLIEIVGAVPLT